MDLAPISWTVILSASASVLLNARKFPVFSEVWPLNSVQLLMYLRLPVIVFAPNLTSDCKSLTVLLNAASSVSVMVSFTVRPLKKTRS